MSDTVSSQANAGPQLNSSVFLIQQPIDTSSPSDQDRQFIAQAVAANETETAEAKLALSHSDDAAVQLFGQWMIADHTAVGAALNGIAEQLGVDTSSVTPDAQQVQEIQSLQSVSGTSFDQLYTHDAVTDHQQALALFRQEAASGSNATLTSFAQQTVPALQQHLAGAEQLAGQPPDATTPPPAETTPQSPAPATGTPSDQDVSFVQFAAQSGLAEVQEGQLALSRSTDPATDTFARWMVTDHTAVNTALQNLAQQEGVTVPTSPSEDQQSEIARLQSLSPDAFAASYSSAAVTDHVTTLMQFVKEATTGQDPAIKAFAQDSIPLLTTHLVGALDLNQLGSGQLAVPSLSGLIAQAYGASNPVAGLAARGSLFASDGSYGGSSGCGSIETSQQGMTAAHAW